MKPATKKPVARSFLTSIFDVRKPTIGIITSEPMPRGAIAMPACIDGYPSSVCSMTGSSTMLPYSTNPSIVIRKTPVA